MNIQEKIAKKQLVIDNTAKLINETEYMIKLLAGKINKMVVDGELKKAEATADRLLELIHDLRILKHKLQFNKDELFALYHDPEYLNVKADDNVLYD